MLLDDTDTMDFRYFLTYDLTVLEGLGVPRGQLFLQEFAKSLKEVEALESYARKPRQPEVHA